MLILLSILFIFHLTITPVSANSEFSVTKDITYKFDQNGDSHISQLIKLTNKYSTIYPKEYQLNIFNQDILNLTAIDSLGNILKNISKSQDSTIISLQFNDPSVNTTKSTDFEIKYTVKSLAQNLGNIKKIDIPKHISNPQDNVSTLLYVPIDWGDIAYSSINISKMSQENNYQIYSIPSSLSSQNISIAFGQTQLFNFNLDYYLKNTQNQDTYQSIPIPPDTSTQTISYSKINPKPSNITIDSDGNFLANYFLSPQENLLITVSGQAQIHPQNLSFPDKPAQSFHTQKDIFWPNAPSISTLGQTLNNPKKIYDYVVDTLDYDYSQISSAKRKSPIDSLAHPKSSLCTDYTDLFISIARSQNIPSREIQGFVYTTNPNINSQSIKGDLLHAWPQFWHQKDQIWQSIDPTWEDTTNGTDYFNSIDLNRLILVYHGQSSQNPPPPGSYKFDPDLKTVTITPTNSYLDIKLVSPTIYLDNKNLVIKNPNLKSIVNLVITNNNFSFEKTIDILPPLATTNLDISNFQNVKSILSSNKNITFDISYQQSHASQPIKNPYHYQYVFFGLIFLGIFITGSIIIIRKLK